MKYNPFKIYDCSNSVERPKHRGGGGPITNDIIRYLKENAKDYYIKFIDNPNKADVIITNDVFPKDIIKLGKPLVKRMCSPFWHKDYQYRNESLNESARIANKVIFISDYSRDQYIYFNGLDIKNHCVVRNWVDPHIFYDANSLKYDKFTFACCATNWNRKEKRLSEIIKFAEIVPNVNIMLIGTCESNVPVNVKKMGYIEEPLELSSLLNLSHGFLNLSYRDAATKTIPQAICCGLPVLFSNSGGVAELVGDYGVEIKDDLSLDILDYIPELSEDEIKKSYLKYVDEFKDIKDMIEECDIKLVFRKMLDGYFEAIVDNG